MVVFLATLFTACGAIVLHLVGGHSNFLPIMYMPILLFWLIRAFQSGRIRDSLLAGSMLALMVWNGGLHNIPGILLPAGALVVVAAAVTRRWRPLLLGSCFVVSGLAYAAPKLLPVSLFVTGERLSDWRPFPHPDLVPLEMLPHVYLNPDAHTGLAENLKWGWGEYGNYVGTFSIIMRNWLAR